MSGVKRKVEDKDPDYEDISVCRQEKRHKAVEHSAREATLQKIELIIKEQFTMEMKNKEHEIEIIDQRLNEARRMMDKLRACIVANYYASAVQPKMTEGPKPYDPTVFNHPVIKKFLESPSRSSSPGNQRSETPSANQSETDSVNHQADTFLDKENDQEQLTAASEDIQTYRSDKRAGRNTGQDTFGVPTPQEIEQRCTYLTTSEDPSRLYIKKTIVVGNVSKYIPPDKREENDQSTHKWMVYVRGSRKEPTIDHFVKKVWFFLHPSYKPNDLVEVSEPPFHLTRRGWGEFPVRIQIHFRDLRNKRIDIIHQLKLDRTYTGLQTLGAETVVDVELHRDSLGEDYLPTALAPSGSSAVLLSSSSSCSSSSSRTPQSVTPVQPAMSSTPPMTSAGAVHVSLATLSSAAGKQSHDSLGFTSEKVKLEIPVKSEMGPSSHSGQSSLERTPTRPVATQKVTFGTHGNSAFQPITASCKIVPQGQLPSPSDSPGKSFQPITMSCKIVSGSPISTPSHSPLPRTPTSTPVHMKQGSSVSVMSNPYIIVDKPGQVIGVSTSNTGSPTTKQTGISQGARSPIPKIHGSSFIATTVKQEDALFAAMPPLCPIGSHSKVQSPKTVTGGLGGFTKVIIKQEPGEAVAQQSGVTAVSTQQAVQQFMTVKGGQVIAVSPQKHSSGLGTGVTQTKVVGIPVGSTLQPVVKQAVALSGGQIIVAKPGTTVARAVSQKQIVAQGVAKAVVSGASGAVVAAPVQAVTKSQSSSTVQKSGSQGSVMATLQLPATNLANLANLPPGTKLYLTTNSKNPSGKGKLLLIPQGAILRAAQPAAAQQVQGASTGTAGSIQGTVVSGLPQQLGYTSYILKQTPQGTFLVGQPVTQASVKHGPGSSVASGMVVQGPSSTSTQQQAIRVSAAQKAVFAQVVPSAQVSSLHSAAVSSLVQSPSPDGAARTLSIASPLSQPGTTTLRVAGGVITTASLSTPVSGTTPATVGTMALQSEVKGSSPPVNPAVSTVKISGQQPSVPVSQAEPSTSQSPCVVSVSSQVAHVVVSQPSAGGSNKASSSAGSGVASFASSSIAATNTLSGQVTPSISVKAEPGSLGACFSPSVPTASTVKVEQGGSDGPFEIIDLEYIENIQQLLTAILKKVPLIALKKNEDSNPFCATSLEQYYSWNIGKRRAAEWQRAVAVRKILQEVMEKCSRFSSTDVMKTKQIMYWCRQRGYTPPDPETAVIEEDSMEDILARIDNEPECPSTYSVASELCQRLMEVEAILKTESESDEEVDIIGTAESSKVKIKKELEEEDDEEVKFYMGLMPAMEYARDTAQQIGVTIEPIEVESRVYAPVIEGMIVKAAELFVSDILRESLKVAYQSTPQNRAPKELNVINVHQAICNVSVCDFLTNKYMGMLATEQTPQQGL
ncbi:YEATS domain-containing protein 2 isoform X2 [Stegostoma tigrinum]|uniref:YEATS domain-containing protein 2 isoform X2 n=1 Tax=Stegostoma tigrinum TaxID=3053191 RepID=UPI00286FDE3E|nr:YEATS domain-containing protein 2 isoform X2 [Stegostoma tigrinum]